MPDSIAGYGASNLPVSEGEQHIAGFTDYLMRVFSGADSATSMPWFSIYVGYYAQ